jgi:hypothetical protein
VAILEQALLHDVRTVRRPRAEDELAGVGAQRLD